MEEQSDTPRTDATQYQWTRTLDLSRDLERELAAATRERDEARAKVEILLATVERAKTVCGATADAYRHDYDSIEQHVAEAVAREREACAALVEEGACACCWGEEAQMLAAEVAEAIRARSDNEPNRLPPHRCSSLCSPDETFCAITKDGKCDALDRSCDAALAATEPKP